MYKSTCRHSSEDQDLRRQLWESEFSLLSVTGAMVSKHASSIPDSCGWQNPWYSVILPNIILILKQHNFSVGHKDHRRTGPPCGRKEIIFCFPGNCQILHNFALIKITGCYSEGIFLNGCSVMKHYYVNCNLPCAIFYGPAYWSIMTSELQGTAL